MLTGFSEEKKKENEYIRGDKATIHLISASVKWKHFLYNVYPWPNTIISTRSVQQIELKKFAIRNTDKPLIHPLQRTSDATNKICRQNKISVEKNFQNRQLFISNFKGLAERVVLS